MNTKKRIQHTKQKEENQYILVNTCKGSLNVQPFISDDLLTFLSTTLYKKTVFHNRSVTSSQQFYSVDVLEANVDLYGNVKLLVT